MLPELWHLFVTFWPLWTLVVLAGVVKFWLEVRGVRRLARSGIHEIDAMDGRTFEIFLSGLFARLGYAVEVTRYRGDYGADLVITKDGRRTAVQAKRWKRAVGIKAVQEAAAATAFYACHDALVVANRGFTRPAQELAVANGVRLWGREELIERLLTANGTAAAASVATNA